MLREYRDPGPGGHALAIEVSRLDWAWRGSPQQRIEQLNFAEQRRSTYPCWLRSAHGAVLSISDWDPGGAELCCAAPVDVSAPC